MPSRISLLWLRDARRVRIRRPTGGTGTGAANPTPTGRPATSSSRDCMRSHGVTNFPDPDSERAPDPDQHQPTVARLPLRSASLQAVPAQQGGAPPATVPADRAAALALAQVHAHPRRSAVSRSGLHSARQRAARARDARDGVRHSRPRSTPSRRPSSRPPRRVGSGSDEESCGLGRSRVGGVTTRPAAG